MDQRALATFQYFVHLPKLIFQKHLMPEKHHLTFWQIINMNVDFFGIQYSLDLQQSTVNPIYDMLGASSDEPLFFLSINSINSSH